MRRLLIIIAVAAFLFAVGYLLLPTPGFPPPPPGVLVSTEPADTETIYRQAYYSNLSRTQVMDYYKATYKTSILPSLRLDIPPEDGATVIRDQTRTSWLEELIYPLRDSVYINGFYPTKPTEQINIGGSHYLNKITVRFVPSHPITRITVLLMASIAAYFLVKEYAKI